MEEPLARYYEVRPSARRRFELFSDRVVVKGKTTRVETLITIKLADLRPEPNILRIRPKEFGLGLLMLVASVGLGFVGIRAMGVGAPAEDKNIMLLCLAGGCLFVSLVVLGKTYRKIEYIQFVSYHGTPLLDVADAGPERSNFRAFVETLIGQIRANQKTDS
jgi:hypothetical protein